VGDPDALEGVRQGWSRSGVNDQLWFPQDYIRPSYSYPLRITAFVQYSYPIH